VSPDHVVIGRPAVLDPGDLLASGEPDFPLDGFRRPRPAYSTSLQAMSKAGASRETRMSDPEAVDGRTARDQPRDLILVEAATREDPDVVKARGHRGCDGLRGRASPGRLNRGARR
jgi:hypothetical protein